MRPFFSIITVTLNDREGLIDTLKSVNQQSFQNWEQLVVDGLSEDGSLEYLETNPDGFKYSYVSEKDDGLYHAMNKGQGMAVGRYFLFLNAGDTLANSDVLGKVLDGISDSGFPDVFYGGVIELTKDGERIYKPPKPPKTIWNTTPTRHQSIFYSHDAVSDVIYDTHLKIAADVAYTATLFLKPSTKVCFADFPVSVFEQGGLSYSNNLLVMRENWYIRRKVFQYGLIKSFAIVVTRQLSRWMQQEMPSVYNFLRYRSKN